jgi:hypothetical protein
MLHPNEYSRAVIRLYVLERGSAVSYIEAVYDGDTLVSAHEKTQE